MKFFERIGDSIVELAFITLLAFLVWGLGYLIINDMENTTYLREQCIAAGKQVIEGNCINE